MGERSENFVLQEDTKGFFGLCAWGSLLGLNPELPPTKSASGLRAVSRL